MKKIGSDIDFASELLKQGKLVAIPTETVYGLAANAFDLTAVSSIFEAKNRPFFDPLILHCPDKDFAFSLFKSFPKEFEKLANKFWPGPLTLVAPKTDKIPDLITAGSPLVAVRVPNHKMTLELLKKNTFPLAAPSANPFGYVSPTNAKHVADQLEDKIDYILDGGDCNVGIESTIVGFKDNEIQLWRLGKISKEEIEEVAGAKVNLVISKSSKPDSSGQLDKHYSPKTKMKIFDLDDFLLELNNVEFYERENIGVINFGNTSIPQGFVNIFNLSENGNFEEAAKNLYKSIRQLDSMNLNLIISIKMPNEGLGRSINDRLKRAAAK